MSAGAPTITIPARFRTPERRLGARAAERDRPWIRLITFAALALYGIERWSTLMVPAPTARLLGVFGLAVALAGVVPLLRRLHPLPAAVWAAFFVLAAFPVAGVPWHWAVHVEIARTANAIGTGLQGLPDALVPYLGSSHAVRLVIALGAAVLALDAAAVMAFAPRSFGDARRAAAALPLIALAVVPSTLVRPQLPYVQGLLLFGLLAAFLWGERVRPGAIAPAVGVAVLAGVAGAIVAPRIDEHRAWIDYRAWAGTPAHVRVDTFDWNQTYGPLHWPRAGHEVLTVRAPTADYWKAEDLDTFNGTDWVLGTYGITSPLPAPGLRSLRRWTHRIDVTVHGMETTDVIAAGDADPPSPLINGVGAGADVGTYVVDHPLGPGATYAIDTYSPHPSAGALARDHGAYPAAGLSNDLTLTIPVPGIPFGSSPQVTFAPFHSGQPPSVSEPSPVVNAGGLLAQSPYAGAYALARRLAAGARTPEAFVAAVLRSLAAPRFSYDEDLPASAYPLERFLFTDRRGYCQQFSGAMALLLRMGGLPARVAAGFTSGTYDPAAREYIVTDTDAHAWVEVWFPGYGWVRFDPTPKTAPARAGTALPTILKSLKGLPTGTTPALSKQVGEQATAPVKAHAAGRSGVSAWVIVLGVLAGAVVAGLLALLVRTGGDSPDELLAELERALARTRRPLADGVTLVALERRFADAPEAAGYVRALRLARYGGRATRPSAAQRRALRQELRRGLGVRGALRSLWALPPRPGGPH